MWKNLHSTFILTSWGWKDSSKSSYTCQYIPVAFSNAKLLLNCNAFQFRGYQKLPYRNLPFWMISLVSCAIKGVTSIKNDRIHRKVTQSRHDNVQPKIYLICKMLSKTTSCVEIFASKLKFPHSLATIAISTYDSCHLISHESLLDFSSTKTSNVIALKC